VRYTRVHAVAGSRGSAKPHLVQPEAVGEREVRSQLVEES